MNAVQRSGRTVVDGISDFLLALLQSPVRIIILNLYF